MLHAILVFLALHLDHFIFCELDWLCWLHFQTPPLCKWTSDIEAIAHPYPSVFSCLGETLIIVVHRDTAN